MENYLDEISQLKQRIAELEAIAYRDVLTGLLNRRAFEDRLEQEWERAVRSQSDISLLFLDLDKLKQTNDLYGHAAGDDLILVSALILAGLRLRPYDVVARYGGDEFAILLPDCNIHGAYRIRDELYSLFREQSVSVSIGGAGVKAVFGLEPELLIAQADVAMYQEKAQQRGAAT